MSQCGGVIDSLHNKKPKMQQYEGIQYHNDKIGPVPGSGAVERKHARTHTPTHTEEHSQHTVFASIPPSVSEAALFRVPQCKQNVTYFDHGAILQH